MAAGVLATRAVLLLDLTLAAAGNGTSDVTMTRPFYAVDVHLVCTATDSGGNATCQVSRQALGAGSFNTLSSAMSCFTAGALARTTTMTNAEQTIAATDVLRATIASASGATANGRVYIHVAPTPITGAA